jgi:hypothetical protein
MKTKSIIQLVLVALFALSSCKKNGSDLSDNTGTGGTTGTTGEPVNGINVYAAGFLLSPIDTSQLIAAIWKNGVPSILSTKPSKANGIARLGMDIYVAGRYRETNNTACYWKNGTLVLLESPSEIIYSEAFGIAFQGNDMYVIGTVYTKISQYAVYWKNGVFNKLPFPDSYTKTTVASITVAGSDVFISGNCYTDRRFMCYWKNGTYNDLPTNLMNVDASGIGVNNNDIHIAVSTGGGFSGPEYLDDGKAYCFKNGSPSALVGTTQAARARAIAFIGNDQYIAGYTIRAFNVPRVGYWKNGAFNGPVADISQASCIKTQGSDVYVGGIYSTLSTMQGYTYLRAAYWKNGVITKLSPTQPAGVVDMIVFPE